MEHSLSEYLRKRTTKELELILGSYFQNGQGEDDEVAIEIKAILELRGREEDTDSRCS